MSANVVDELLDELAKRHIRLALKGGQLVARGPKGGLTPELAERVREHKAPLVALLVAGELAALLTGWVGDGFPRNKSD